MTSSPDTIHFGGKDRALKFRPSNMREFERIQDETLAQAFPKKGYETLATLLYVGLKWEDDKLNVNRVFEYLDDYADEGNDISEIWDLVGRALIAGNLIGGKKGKAQAQTPTT